MVVKFQLAGPCGRSAAPVPALAGHARSCAFILFGGLLRVVRGNCAWPAVSRSGELCPQRDVGKQAELRSTAAGRSALTGWAAPPTIAAVVARRRWEAHGH